MPSSSPFLDLAGDLAKARVTLLAPCWNSTGKGRKANEADTPAAVGLFLEAAFLQKGFGNVQVLFLRDFYQEELAAREEERAIRADIIEKTCKEACQNRGMLFKAHSLPPAQSICENQPFDVVFDPSEDLEDKIASAANTPFLRPSKIFVLESLNGLQWNQLSDTLRGFNPTLITLSAKPAEESKGNVAPFVAMHRCLPSPNKTYHLHITPHRKESFLEKLEKPVIQPKTILTFPSPAQSNRSKVLEFARDRQLIK